MQVLEVLDLVWKVGIKNLRHQIIKKILKAHTKLFGVISGNHQPKCNTHQTRWDKKSHWNQDISTVEVSQIPDPDLLVGGFLCQDYSVATTLKNSKGLIGKNTYLQNFF